MENTALHLISSLAITVSTSSESASVPAPKVFELVCTKDENDHCLVSIDRAKAIVYPFFQALKDERQHEVTLWTADELRNVKDYIEKGIVNYNRQLYDYFSLIPTWLRVGNMLDVTPECYMTIRLEEAWHLMHPQDSHDEGLITDVEKYRSKKGHMITKQWQLSYDPSTVKKGQSHLPLREYVRLPMVKEDNNVAYDRILEMIEHMPHIACSFSYALADEAEELLVANLFILSKYEDEGKETTFDPSIGISEVVNEIVECIVQDEETIVSHVREDDDFINIWIECVDEDTEVCDYHIVRIHRMIHPSINHVLATIPVDSQCKVTVGTNTYANSRFFHAFYSQLNVFNYYPVYSDIDQYIRALYADRHVTRINFGLPAPTRKTAIIKVDRLMIAERGKHQFLSGIYDAMMTDSVDHEQLLSSFIPLRLATDVRELYTLETK